MAALTHPPKLIYLVLLTWQSARRQQSLYCQHSAKDIVLPNTTIEPEPPSVIIPRFRFLPNNSVNNYLARYFVLDGFFPILTFGPHDDFHTPDVHVSYNILFKISFGGTEDEYTDEVASEQTTSTSIALCPWQTSKVSASSRPSYSPARGGTYWGYMKLNYSSTPDLSLLPLAVPESKKNPGKQHILDRDPTSGHMFVTAL